MASIATFITQAIEKVSHDETYANMEFATSEEARANFTAALLFELGLGPKPAAAHAPVTEVKDEKKAPKKRAPKKAQEAPKEVEALAEQMGQLALDEQPKPKKARKTGSGEPVSDSEASEKKKPGPKKTKAKVAEPDSDVTAWDAMGNPVANAGAGAEPAKAEKKKPGPKPKAKPEGPVNVEKLTPTHKKHLKAIAEELKVDPRDKEFLVYANGLTAEQWSAKPLDDHIRDFLTPTPAPLSPAPTCFLQVEFNGKEYLVDPETKYIYALVDDDQKIRERDRLGIVGVKEFADMEIPEGDE